MRTDDVEGEIRKQYQTQPLNNVQLICDLWVDLVMLVVCRMDLAEEGQLVQSQVEEEEQSIID